MHALLLTLTLFCQVDVGVPPSPGGLLPPPPRAAAPSVPSTAIGESVEDMRVWLLTRLILDLSFDAQKSAEVEKVINTMNERQLRVLIDVYKERSAKQAQASKADQETAQLQAIEQAKLNQQQAEAYRDHLKREYDRSILQGFMTQNLVYQNIVNNQNLPYITGGPYTYGSFGYGPYGYGGGYGGIGYGGIGYGGLNYGGFGYGGGSGGPMMYGSPAYGAGLGFY